MKLSTEILLSEIQKVKGSSGKKNAQIPFKESTDFLDEWLHLIAEHYYFFWQHEDNPNKISKDSLGSLKATASMNK